MRSKTKTKETIMACGERCCCILGGCGCGPRLQTEAMINLIMERTRAKREDASAAAEEIFEIFGRGPHKARLRELGVSEQQIEAEPRE